MMEEMETNGTIFTKTMSESIIKEISPRMKPTTRNSKMSTHSSQTGIARGEA